VGPERFEENLRRFVTVAREHRIHLAFVDFPYRELDRGPSPGEKFPNPMQNVRSLEELHALHDSYQAIVARVAAETGTPLIRTREAMRTAPEPTFSAHDLSHPNAAGYDVVAQRIHTELRALGWLDPSHDTP
jgi:lysophospholipase L1-like esterase